MVRSRGLEPPRLAALDPKSSVYANFTTTAYKICNLSYFRMNKVGISKIPVVDKDKNMIGILSMKDIAKDQFAFNYSYVDATYDNICEVIKGTEILRFDDDIEGELLVASYKSTTFMEEITLNKNNILIVVIDIVL